MMKVSYSEFLATPLDVIMNDLEYYGLEQMAKAIKQQEINTRE